MGYVVVSGVATRKKDASILAGIALTAALFFYLYGVNFTFTPTYTSRLIVVIGAAYLLLLACIQRVLPVDRSLVLLGGVYATHLVWLVAISVLLGPSDLLFLAGSLMLPLHALVGGLFFTSILRSRGYDVRAVIFLVQVVITIQALLIVLYFVSAGFREWTFAYIPEGGNIDHRAVLYRSRGLTHSSGATLSVIQSFGALFSAYLLATSRVGRAEFWYLLISFALLVVSIVLTGRTGLLVLPVVAAYFVLVSFARGGVSNSMLVFVAMVPLALTGAYLGLWFGYQSLLGAGGASAETFDMLVRWVVGGFFEDGRFESRTVEILQSHWFSPDNQRVFWLGDLSTWMERRIPSDIGYVRVLFATGFIGLVIYYGFFAAMFAIMVLRAPTMPQRILFAMWGGFLFVLEAKEPFFNNLRVNVFVVLMLLAVVLADGSRIAPRKVQRVNGAGGKAVRTA